MDFLFYFILGLIAVVGVYSIVTDLPYSCEQYIKDHPEEFKRGSVD